MLFLIPLESLPSSRGQMGSSELKIIFPFSSQVYPDTVRVSSYRPLQMFETPRRACPIDFTAAHGTIYHKTKQPQEAEHLSMA